MNPGRERSRRASWRTRCKVSRFAILDTGGLCSERFGFFPGFSARSFSRSSNTTFPFGRRKPRSLPDRGQKRATHSQRDRQTKKMAWSASVAPKVDELQMLDCTNGQISSSCEVYNALLDFFRRYSRERILQQSESALNVLPRTMRTHAVAHVVLLFSTPSPFHLPNTNSTLPFTSCAVYQWFCRRKLAWFCQAYIFQSGYHYLTYFRSSLRSRSFSMAEPVFQKKCNGHPRSRTLRRGNGKSSSTTCYQGKSSVESMSSLSSQMRFNYFARTAITGDSALMCV